MHLNDSKGELGCHLDRHENIGRGKIGLAAFKRVMREPRFSGIPMILETPCAEDSTYATEIKLLESMQWTETTQLLVEEYQFRHKHFPPLLPCYRRAVFVYSPLLSQSLKQQLQPWRDFTQQSFSRGLGAWDLWLKKAHWIPIILPISVHACQWANIVQFIPKYIFNCVDWSGIFHIFAGDGVFVQDVDIGIICRWALEPPVWAW